mmetsp:Transcript_33744/g.61136  ORF Transcript_33744/g.61136 Transcript_33744/m.61136 type:complete len:264 (-) Transcript_33744:352-1143(-)
MKPALRDAFFACSSSHYRSILLEKSPQRIQAHVSVIRDPLYLPFSGHVGEEIPAILLVPESTVFTVITHRELLDDGLQTLRLVNLEMFVHVAPLQREALMRPKIKKFEHCRKERHSEVLALNGVSTNDGCIYVHIDERLILRTDVSLDDIHEVVLIFHGVKDICLYQDDLALFAIVNDRVPSSSVFCETVFPFRKLDEVSCGYIPQVANARTAFSTTPLQIVIEEEDPRSFSKHLLTSSTREHSRYHFRCAIYLLAFPPSCET